VVVVLLVVVEVVATICFLFIFMSTVVSSRIWNKIKKSVEMAEMN